MSVDCIIANGVKSAADVDFIVDEVDENIGNIGLILHFEMQIGNFAFGEVKVFEAIQADCGVHALRVDLTKFAVGEEGITVGVSDI